MARYAIFEDATSTTYGATNDRPIWLILDTSDATQLAVNTPSGYTNLVLTTETQDTHYITWSGSAFVTAPKYEAWIGAWGQYITVNGSALSSFADVPTDMGIQDGRQVWKVTTKVWTADGSAKIVFDSLTIGAYITVKVYEEPNVPSPAKFLAENFTRFDNTATAGTPYVNMEFTTTLGEWLPFFGAIGPTTYAFEVNDFTYIPYTLLIEAQ